MLVKISVVSAGTKKHIGTTDSINAAMESKRQRRDTLFVLALLGLGILLACFELLGPDRTLLFGDHLVVFRPRFYEVLRSFQLGELPALTRASPGGVPLEAMLNASYTPTTLLLFLGDFEFSYDLFVLSHLPILGLGVYALARRLQVPSTTAAAVAGVFTLSGWFISCNTFVSVFQGLAYAAWMYWAFHRLLSAPSLMNVGLQGLLIGFRLQGITPEFALLDLFAATLIFCSVKPKVSLQLTGRSMLALILGLGVCALEVLPVLELLEGTKRGAGFSYAEAKRWPLTGPRWIEFFVPTFWAPPQAPFISFPFAYDGESQPSHLRSFYFGSAMSVAGAGLLSRRRWAWVFLGMTIFGLMAASGDATPLHRVLTSLPLLENARFPTKYLVFTVVGVAGLTGFGFQVAAKAPRKLLAIIAIQLFVLVIGFSVITSPEFLGFVNSNINKESSSALVRGLDFSEYPRIAVGFMRQHSLHAMGFTGLMFLVVLLAAARPALSGYISYALLAVLILDLGIASRYALVSAPAFPASPPKEIMNIISGDQQRIYAVSPNGRALAVPHQPGETYFAEEVYSRRQRGAVAYQGIRRLEDRDMDAQSHPASVLAFRLLQDAKGNEGLRILARAGVHWLTSWSKLGRKHPISWPIEGEPPQYLISVPNTRAYVSAYPSWVQANPKSRSPAQLAKLYGGEAHFDHAIIWSGQVSTSTLSPKAADQCRDGQSIFVQRQEEYHIDMQTKSNCPSIVVALETVQRRWQVRLDGVSTDLLTAEFGALAVFVPAGKHRVEFIYSPTSSKWVLLFVFSVLMSLVLCLLGLRPRD